MAASSMKKRTTTKVGKKPQKLKFAGKHMQAHLEESMRQLRSRFGAAKLKSGVTYKLAMPVVGATLASRLTARGLLARAEHCGT